MSTRLKSKYLVAKNYVSTKIGMETFQEPAIIQQRKQELKTMETLYATLESKLVNYLHAWEALLKSSSEISTLITTIARENDTAINQQALDSYSESLTYMDSLIDLWICELRSDVIAPVHATQEEIKRARNLRNVYFENALEAESMEGKLYDARVKGSPKISQIEKDMNDFVSKRDASAQLFMTAVASVHERRSDEIVSIVRELLRCKKRLADGLASSFTIPSRLSSSESASTPMPDRPPPAVSIHGAGIAELSEESCVQPCLANLVISPSRESMTTPSPNSSRSNSQNSITRKVRRSPRFAHSFVKASFGYASGKDNELSFREGDRIAVLDKDPSGWWLGELHGRQGYFPENHTRPE